jgi:hypothetical protein
MPIHVNQALTWNVTVAFAMMWLGAMLALAVDVWREQAGGWAQGGHRPLVFRACCAAGIGLCSLGILWQLVGYLRLEYTTWWTW